jgi:hypothetical protein
MRAAFHNTVTPGLDPGVMLSMTRRLDESSTAITALRS